MEEAISLLTSMRRGGMEPMEPVFLLSLRLHLRLRFLGSHVWNANASANESERKWKFFHFLLWRLRLCLHLRWCSSHVYFLALRLHLRRTCERGLRHNPSFTSLYCRTLQRTLVVSRTKFWWHIPGRIFPSGQERCLRNPGSSEAECSSDGERKAQATVK